MCVCCAVVWQATAGDADKAARGAEDAAKVNNYINRSLCILQVGTLTLFQQPTPSTSVLWMQLRMPRPRLVTLPLQLQRSLCASTMVSDTSRVTVRQPWHTHTRPSSQSPPAPAAASTAGDRSGDGVTEERVGEMIDSAIDRLHADGIGLPDYAINSCGATIAFGDTELLSKTYEPPPSVIDSLMGALGLVPHRGQSPSDVIDVRVWG